MNAIDFLTQEHHRVKKMLAEIDISPHNRKVELFSKLGVDLIRHEEMEHTVWYPNFSNDSRLKDTVRHLLKEENFAEREIEKFNRITDDDLWDLKFREFKRNLEHHAEEEETELFPEVEKLLDASKLDKIGKQMKKFKEDYDLHH